MDKGACIIRVRTVRNYSTNTKKKTKKEKNGKGGGGGGGGVKDTKFSGVLKNPGVH